MKSPYIVTRFPDDFPADRRSDLDGKWHLRLIQGEEFDWVDWPRRGDNDRSYKFRATGVHEEREDGELAEVFMLAWPKVKRWAIMREEDWETLTLRRDTPRSLWYQVEQAYKELMAGVGDRVITGRPKLQIIIALEAEEPKNLPEVSSGSAAAE